VIHYHGTPMTPAFDAARFFRGRHAMVSFATGRAQLPMLAEVCQSFALDNGAFSAWTSGAPITDWSEYYTWCGDWLAHPGCDWALIPDVIDGDEAANDALVEEWPFDAFLGLGVPVWHLHESIERLVKLYNFWPRVAFGSSGQFAQIGTTSWWARMAEALEAICYEHGGGEGSPMTKLHGLRMLDPTIFSHIPFASADSTNVARNMGLDQNWRGRYVPTSPEVRAYVIADRIEAHASAARWCRTHGVQQNLGLLG